MDVHEEAVHNVFSGDKKLQDEAWQHINGCPDCSNKMDEATKRFARAIFEKDEESDT